MKAHEAPASASIDWYKFTMGDMMHGLHPDIEQTLTFKNRNLDKGVKISRLISPQMLDERFDAIRERGFGQAELGYMDSVDNKVDGGPQLTASYIDYLDGLQLPKPNVSINPETGELDITAEHSLWETIIMSEVSELHHELRREELGLSKAEVWAEGERRILGKIALLREHPDLTFDIVEFGTRRRSSLEWQEHALDIWLNEAPEYIKGTSNPYLANKFGIAVVGTFAHEMDMTYAALETAYGNNPLDGHVKMLRDWEQYHRGDLTIALTDTFTSDYFFKYFTPEQASKWKGLRHDSGDPVEFGEKAIKFYEQNGIDPREKVALFSDGLKVPVMVRISKAMGGRILHPYGVGTDFTNDMHDMLPADNIVVKVTEVNGEPTVKLSDDAGKHTGPESVVRFYEQEVEKLVA